MENLVEGYDLLDKGLHGYVIQDILIVYKGLEIVAKSEDGIKTVKLQFREVSDIYLNWDSVSGVIFDIKLEKSEEGELEVIIEKTEGIGMELVAKKLVVTWVYW